jgi:hypothetical protein
VRACDDRVPVSDCRYTDQADDLCASYCFPACTVLASVHLPCGASVLSTYGKRAGRVSWRRRRNAGRNRLRGSKRPLVFSVAGGKCKSELFCPGGGSPENRRKSFLIFSLLDVVGHASILLCEMGRGGAESFSVFHDAAPKPHRRILSWRNERNRLHTERTRGS